MDLKVKGRYMRSQLLSTVLCYHGNSNPWFSPLDTFGYFKDLAAANGGLEAVSKWSQFYFVPQHAHYKGQGNTEDANNFEYR
jgi:feruloyl esterase